MRPPRRNGPPDLSKLCYRTAEASRIAHMVEPQFTKEVPLGGWVELTVGGESLTCVSVDEGEEVEVTITRGCPRDDVDMTRTTDTETDEQDT